MIRSGVSSWVVAAVALMAAGTAAARAQGASPADAVKKMTVAPGFEVRLVASEPLMAQPVCIEFDDRGRLWVVQYLQYPNPAGLKRVKVDRYSRTEYDKVPEPPPYGPRGADRVTILEDTNGDGAADRAHDFVHGLNLATSIVFGHGGVFVMQAPYLLFYPDRNGDDVPDGDPEVLLGGFGIEDAQSFANALIWGPDGWLYGCQGSTVTAVVRGIEFQQAIWRYHPVTRRFELFTEGGGNMWGLDYDRDGNLFSSTNGGGGAPQRHPDLPRPYPGAYVNFRMFHMVQGGFYAKAFAKHGELHNPHAYGYFERVPAPAYHGGLHVTTGGTLYQGGSFPSEFSGRFLGNDLLAHRVQWHDLEPWGTTYKAKHGGDLLIANDTWFAPSDMVTGPDGAIYVADWSDKRMSHPDPDAEWDRSNGRVYRVQWSAAPAKSAAASLAAVLNGEAASLTGLASTRLADLLDHPNDWIVRRARRILTERRDVATYPALRDKIARGGDDQGALEAFWTLYGAGGANDAYLRDQLSHASPRIRRWAVRFLGDEEKISSPTENALIALAAGEPAAAVRRQLASTAARLSPAAGLRVAQRLALQNRDRDDPHIPLLLWWAVERHAVGAMATTLELFNTPAVWQSALAREMILPRLMRRYAAEGGGPALQECAALLAGHPLAGDRGPFLSAFDQGLRHPSPTRNGLLDLDQLPAALATQLTALWQNGTRDESAIRLLTRLGFGPARARALELAGDSSVPSAPRTAMIRILGDPARAADIPRFQSWIAGSEVDEIKLAALEALQTLDTPAVATALLEVYPQLGASLRSRVRAALFSRKSGALALLGAVDAGKLAARDVAQAEIRGLAEFRHAEIDALVRKHWGKISPTPEDKLAVVRRFSNDLSLNRGKEPGVPARGRLLFQQYCAACHVLFGEGGRIGPDLTTANRKDKDFFLTSLVDPSAVIRKEFLNYNVTTKDGRAFSGTVLEEGAGDVTFVNLANERTTLSWDTIASMEDSGVSLMPEGLLNALTPQQLRDLFAHLQSDSASKR